jgi:hypothetical protein
MPYTQPLPNHSCAHVRAGMWYVFRDGQNIIRAWGSDWTGLERVYFNETQVLTEHPLKRSNDVSFSVMGQHYRLECQNRPAQRWQVKCRLHKNHRPLCVIRCKRRRLLNVRPMWAQMLFGAAIGLLAGVIEVPPWFGIGFIMFAFFLTLLTLAKREDFLIEEDRLQPSYTPNTVANGVPKLSH